MITSKSRLLPLLLAMLSTGCRDDCDQTRLAEAARAIEVERASWTPADGRAFDASETAAAAIWQACARGLTPPMRQLVDAAVYHPTPEHVRAGLPAPAEPPDDPVERFLPGHANAHAGLAPGSHDEFTRPICPDYASVMTRLAEVGGDQRAEKAFVECGMKEGDPKSKAEFVAHGVPVQAIQTLALRHWLIARGATPDVATTLIEPLWRSTSTLGRFEMELGSEMQLPAARTGASAVEELPDVVVSVTPSQVVASNAVVQAFDTRRPSPWDLEVLTGATFDVLAEELEKHSRVADDERVELLIAADREATLAVVDALLAAAARAGVGVAGLVAVGEDPVAPLRMLPLEPVASGPTMAGLGHEATTQALVDALTK